MDEFTRSLKSFTEAIDSFTAKAATKIEAATTKLATRVPGGGGGPPPRVLTPTALVRAPPPAPEDEALRKRVDLILEQLPGSYYDAGADALHAELAQLPEDAKQGDVDAVVERLTGVLEARAAAHARCCMACCCMAAAAWSLLHAPAITGAMRHDMRAAMRLP